MLSKEFLTVEEAAVVLGVGRTLAYEAVRRGEIPSARIGRIIRVPKAALLQMRAAQSEVTRDRSTS
jgi:excisionase family DNA binding protein